SGADVQQRRLAASGGAHDRDELARGHVERGIAHRRVAPARTRERARDALERQRRGHLPASAHDIRRTRRAAGLGALAAAGLGALARDWPCEARLGDRLAPRAHLYFCAAFCWNDMSIVLPRSIDVALCRPGSNVLRSLYTFWAAASE